MRPVTVPELPYAGRLSIWRCPRISGPRLSSEDQEILRSSGVTRLVCLVEEFELEMLDEGLSERAAATEANAITFHSIPIEDFTAPSPAQYTALLNEIVPALEAGEHVLVHCMAGLGRAGTVAAALLVNSGMQADAAIELVRWVRPGAIQSDEQERFITSVARRDRTRIIDD